MVVNRCAICGKQLGKEACIAYQLFFCSECADWMVYIRDRRNQDLVSHLYPNITKPIFNLWRLEDDDNLLSKPR